MASPEVAAFSTWKPRSVKSAASPSEKERSCEAIKIVCEVSIFPIQPRNINVKVDNSNRFLF